MSRTLGEALKYTRRRVYLHGPKWRVLIIGKTPAMTRTAYDEVLRIMQASSLEVESSQIGAQTFIQLSSGAMIRFATIRDDLDLCAWKGQPYPHIMWLYDPHHKLWEGTAPLCRSGDDEVQKDAMHERVDL